MAQSIDKILFKIELAIFGTCILLALNWIRYPDGISEPWTYLFGLIGAGIEIARRLITDTSLFHRPAKPNLRHSERSHRLLNWIDEHIHTAKLSESMPRCLQLAERIGDIALAKWIKMEHVGYSAEGGMTDDDIVPEYRSVCGVWMNSFDQILDLSGSPDLSFINTFRLRFGVSMLEELSTKTDMINIRPEDLIDTLRRNMKVEMVRFCFSPVEVRGILEGVMHFSRAFS